MTTSDSTSGSGKDIAARVATEGKERSRRDLGSLLGLFPLISNLLHRRRL
jgi:hypothetical protein